jgi:CRISPR-associated endonuclease/helicase Cas3
VRAPRFAQPRTIVLVREDRRLESFITEAGERRGLAQGPHGWGTVYPDLRTLEATWRLIEKMPQWDLPAMNRLIVEQATHPSHLGAITSELKGRWMEHAQRMDGIRAAERIFAQGNLVSRNVSFDDVSALYDSDVETTIRTRLGLDDRVVRFDPPFEGPFGNAINTLTIPGWMIDGESSESLLPSEIRTNRGEILFNVGRRSLRYDRLGLRKEDTHEPPER